MAIHKKEGRRICRGPEERESDRIQNQAAARVRPRGAAAAESPGKSFARLIVNAREAEKRKISSALHDETGTAAVVINSLLSILKEDIKDGKKAAALEDIARVREAFEDSIARIKRVIVNLRPPQLEEAGLGSAVKNFIDMLAGAVPLKINCSYKIKGGGRMSDTVKIILYRVVQEAVSNTLKHAKAARMDIRFTEDANSVFLDISDDGIGYPGARRRSAGKLGILGMEENLSYIGGSFKIRGVKGKGTVISVSCPKIIYVRDS
jgi:signal transduction histidine kinase